MRRSLNFIATLILLCLFLACGSNKKKDLHLYEKLEKSITRMQVDNVRDDDVILVINMKGCSVCYSRALYFLENNIQFNSVQYIITEIPSRKNLLIKLGDDVISSANVHLDLDGIIYSSGIRETYPMIFYRENGELRELEVADLSNEEAYSRLSGFLTTEN